MNTDTNENHIRSISEMDESNNDNSDLSIEPCET